jgi:uncharacterized protein (DUF1501 family)
MKKNRREFLKRSGCALGMTALATQFQHFGLMNALAQKTNDKIGGIPGNYRAIVCIFFAGGNDGNNTVIPKHNDSSVSNYADYSAQRNPQGLAIAQKSLLNIRVPRMGNLIYGLHPALGAVEGGINNGIYELWAKGKMAIATNVGTLAKPITREEYINRTAPIPYQLFSHSDQIEQSQSGRSDIKSYTGWGGRLSDKMTSTSNPGGLVPMITSIKGVQLFTSGALTLPLTIKHAATELDRVLALHGFNPSTESQARLAALNEIRTQDLDQEYVAAASRISDQAVQASQALSSFEEVTVDFPDTEIGKQLKQIARMIKKRGELNVNRQVFYCQVDGFDNHSNQVGIQNSLLTEFSQAARAFYDEMGVQGISGDITTFTMSDFSRTLNPAGLGDAVGSDHGWGNHHFVIGDSVIGGDFYGLDTSNGTPFPTLALNGPDDSDNGTGARGRWIPTTSVEQYAATIARWYGLAENDMLSVFPNINAFSGSDLGFMN